MKSEQWPESRIASTALSSRPYRNEDLPHVRQVVAEWRHRAGFMGTCHAGEIAGRISEQQPVAELVRIWEDGRRIVGLEINHRFGCAFDVFTDPTLRGSLSELAMLESAYATTSRRMSEHGSQESVVVSDVVEGDALRAEMLSRLGFECYRVWDHLVERGLATALAEPALPTGFSLRHANNVEMDELVRVRAGSFGTVLTADDFFLRNQVDDVRRQEIVAVSPEGRAAAFAVLWFDELNKVGHVEPVGTHGDFRRLGLARSVLLAGLREMSRCGMTVAAVQYDVTNRAADALYSSLGFEKRYTTLGYRCARNSSG